MTQPSPQQRGRVKKATHRLHKVKKARAVPRLKVAKARKPRHL